jgi:hypothetical protein
VQAAYGQRQTLRPPLASRTDALIEEGAIYV